jgi:hypothetical protein
MGKRWKKGKFKKEVTQEKEITGLARGRWEEKLLKRTKEEREKENKKRKGEIDGRLAIMILSTIAGTAQQQSNIRNQYQDDTDDI